MSKKSNLNQIDNAEVIPYDVHQDYAKSNFLISAKFKSTLLENKLFAIALMNIQESGNEIYCKIRASELKKLLKVRNDSGSFYKNLDKASKGLTGQVIGFSDPVNQTFEYLAVITKAYYENSLLEIKFNPELRNYIVGIKKNFTILNLPIMLSFNSVYSFRLYELLKSRAYYPKNTKSIDNGLFRVHFNISELKLNLGVVDSDDKSVKLVLERKKSPTPEMYDEAVNVAGKQVFKEWRDFKKKVLDVAVTDINESPNVDMQVSYELIKSGRGGKVTSIDFIVDLKKKNEDSEEVVEEKIEVDIDDFCDELADVIEERLKIKDLRAIAEASEYNLEKVKKAYNIAKENKNISNLTGFLIKAITDNYSEAVEKKGKGAKKNSFNDFEQRDDYNIDELERELVVNRAGRTNVDVKE